MDLALSGKRALVSGSTAGIGFAIAATLAQEGAHVIVNGRSQAAVDSAVIGETHGANRWQRAGFCGRSWHCGCGQ